MAVQPRLTERIDPRHDRCELSKLRAQNTLWAGRSQLVCWRNFTARSRRDWSLVSSCKNSQTSVSLDSDRHFGANEIEALCAELADEQASAGEPDFGLRRTRNNRAVLIAYDDVAQSQRRPPLFVAFELRASYGHRMVTAKIFLNRGFKPRGHQIKLDWAA